MVRLPSLLLLAGEEKSKYPWYKIWLLSIVAGFYVGFGYTTTLLVGGMLDQAPGVGSPEETNIGVYRLVSGAVGFPFAFTTIVVCGSELYTSLCAYMTAAWWEGKVSWGARKPEQCVRAGWCKRTARGRGILAFCACVQVLHARWRATELMHQPHASSTHGRRNDTVIKRCIVLCTPRIHGCWLDWRLHPPTRTRPTLRTHVGYHPWQRQIAPPPGAPRALVRACVHTAPRCLSGTSSACWPSLGRATTSAAWGWRASWRAPWSSMTAPPHCATRATSRHRTPGAPPSSRESWPTGSWALRRESVLARPTPLPRLARTRMRARTHIPSTAWALFGVGAGCGGAACFACRRGRQGR